MKYTLLDMVQIVASSMDSDEVNSIGDSVESLQIANVVKQAYMDMLNRATLPENYTLINLDPSLDASKPVLMYRPETVEEIKWIKYNKLLATGGDVTFDHDLNMDIVDNPEDVVVDTIPTFEEVEYIPLRDFLMRMHALREDNTNVGSFSLTINVESSNTFTIFYKNNKQPDFYTTFDDRTVVFDSYDARVESTLQSANSLAYAKLRIHFSMSDGFIPNLEDDRFPLLINEAKSLAWAELKQTAHSIADRNARRGWTHVQKTKDSIDYPMRGFNELPFFGRR